MENEDKNIGLIEGENINNSNIFKPDYMNQNLDNNINFENWKSSMIKNGNKGKFYKCPNDKIYFYEEKNGIVGDCPLCKHNICFFCMNNITSHNCCAKRKFILMCEEGKRNLNRKMSDLND